MRLIATAAFIALVGTAASAGSMSSATPDTVVTRGGTQACTSIFVGGCGYCFNGVVYGG